MKDISPSAIIRSLIAEGREDAALDMCRSLGIDTADTHCEIHDLLESRGDLPRMLELSEDAVRRFPMSPGIATRRVQALMAAHRPIEAAELARSFIEKTEDHGLWALRAESLMRAGDPEQAGEVLQRYMPANPGNAGAWLITARLLNAFPHPNAAGILSGLNYEISTLPVEIDRNAGLLQFARGLMLETLGDYEEAAAAFTRGNRILDDLEMSDPEEETHLSSRLIENITADWIKSRAIDADGGNQPIFLLGTPHSGLREAHDILRSDPDIDDAGEPRMLERDLYIRLGAPHERDYAQGMARMTASDLAELRARYLDTLPRTARAAPAFVDATPSNMRHAGLLRAMFPKARFVLCAREETAEILDTFRAPMDVRAHRESADIGKIRTAIAARRTLAGHWAGIFGSDMTTMTAGSGALDLEQLRTGGAIDHQASAPDWPATPEAARQAYLGWLA